MYLCTYAYMHIAYLYVEACKFSSFLLGFYGLMSNANRFASIIL